MTQAEEIYKKAQQAKERAREVYTTDFGEIYRTYLKDKEEAYKTYQEKAAELYKHLAKAEGKAYRAWLKVEDEKYADRTNTEVNHSRLKPMSLSLPNLP